MAPPLEKPVVHVESTDVVRLFNEYENTMPRLGDVIARMGAAMQEMRNAGIPNRPAYEKIRTTVVRALERTTDLRSRLNKILLGETDVPPTVVSEAQRIERDHDIEFGQAESSFSDVLRADAKWHDEQAQKGKYGRRATDYGPLPGERSLPLELYDRRLQEELFPEIGALEQAFEYGTSLSVNKLEMLHEGLTDIYERLTKLDEQTPGYNDSKERRALVSLLRQIKERYPLPSMRPPPPLPPPPTPMPSAPKVVPAQAVPTATLQAAFQAHTRARAEYASVSYRLSDDRRRYYRGRMAQLSSLVDAAAEDAWRSVVSSRARPSPPPPEPPSLQDPALRERVALAMTRASLAARPIADSVISRRRQRRGVLASLAGAFRLK